MLLTGLRAARNRNGNHVMAAIGAAMTAMTASRRTGSSAPFRPPCRQRAPASSTAITINVKALKANSSVYQVAARPRNSPAPTTAAQPPAFQPPAFPAPAVKLSSHSGSNVIPASRSAGAREAARRPDHVSTSIGGNSTVIIAA